jgi:hypothetical protein
MASLTEIAQGMKAATVAQATVPPYAPYRSFRNFIDSLKQGIPARIDRSVMSSFSGALQSQLTTTLRYLGLTKESGHPTELLAKLVNSEGPERVKVMRDILVFSYPFLFGTFDLKSATPRMLEEQFSEMGASGGTLDKCTNFFLAAAKDAGIETSHHFKIQRGPRIQRRQRTNRGSENPPNSDDSSTSLNDNGGGDLSWSQMLLSKFPSFDPAWPDEVKAKWFDGFHRLMRMKEGDKE